MKRSNQVRVTEESTSLQEQAREQHGEQTLWWGGGSEEVATQTVVPTGRGMLTEVEPPHRGQVILGCPPPQPGPHPQASWLHSYLGHCIPLWAPRSQRRVRLEGSERRVRSKVTGAAAWGHRRLVAREAGPAEGPRASRQQGGPTEALLATHQPCPKSPYPRILSLQTLDQEDPGDLERPQPIMGPAGQEASPAYAWASLDKSLASSSQPWGLGY